jgi:hypothetical protein
MTVPSALLYTLTRPQLELPGFPALTKQATILAGAALQPGAVLGRVVGAVSAPVALGANTGNGTFAATPTVAAGVQEGDYKLLIIEPGANAGVFGLFAPDGQLVGKGAVGAAYTGGHLAFTLNDGATDFVSGDAFTITVARGTTFRLCAAAATDGSHVPRAILATPADAAAGNKDAAIYIAGVFNRAGLTFGAGHTASTVEAVLEAANIHLRDVIAV